MYIFSYSFVELFVGKRLLYNNIRVLLMKNVLLFLFLLGRCQFENVDSTQLRSMSKGEYTCCVNSYSWYPQFECSVTEHQLYVFNVEFC